jgi:predicted Fe-Mo cluster-binding NifX family protein
MRIAIPVNEKSIESDICISFGRAPYFMFYNTESKNTEFFDNSANSVQGGAGIKAAQSIVDAKCQAVLTMHCGENAVDVLKADDIKVYKANDSSIKENLKAFENNELEILKEIRTGLHKQG